MSSSAPELLQRLHEVNEANGRRKMRDYDRLVVKRDLEGDILRELREVSLRAACQDVLEVLELKRAQTALGPAERRVVQIVEAALLPYRADAPTG